MDEQMAAGSIVAAVDGSADAERGLRWAAEQADLEGCPLVVVTAGGEDVAVADEAVAEVRRLHPDLDVQAQTTFDDPREVLLDLSKHARLLVLGSRGRGPLKTLLLGSVSTAVTAQADCPVVVCRPVSEDTPRRGVVVGADGTPESLPVIEFAYRQASLRGLPLTVLHSYWDAAAVVAQYRAARGQTVEVPELEDLRALLAQSVAGFGEKYPDVRVDLRLEYGLADEALDPGEGAWDLIVVGRHPMTSVPRLLLGSIATSVVERARSTVAVVPQHPAED